MRRRAFIGLLSGTAVAGSLDAWAQQSKSPLIGVLEGASAATMAPRYEAFRAGLRELGYIEGVNVRLEYRYADGFLARLPALAAELVRLQPSVIVSAPLSANLAASKPPVLSR